MSFEKIVEENGIVKFSFVTEKEFWHEAREKAALKVQKKVKLDGFRQGKAPINMVKKLYAKEIFDEAAEDLFEKSYRDEVLAELATIRIYDEVGLNVTKVTEDELEYTFNFILMPDFVLKQYKGLEVTVAKHEVTEKAIDDAINAEADKLGRWQDVDRAPVNGDTVNINFEGYIGEEKFEGGTAENFDLVLGSGQFIPGFEDQIVGMEIGSVKDVIVTFPTDYGMETLNGKEAKFIVKLNSVKVKELPNIDDEFAIDCGYDTLQAMKAKKQEELTEQMAKENEREKENAVIDALMLANPVVVYDAIIENELAKDKQRQEERMKQFHITFEQYLQYLGTTPEQYTEEKKLHIRDDVHTRLIFMAVLQEEKFEATDLEIQAEIEKNAARENKPVEEFKKNLKEEDMHYFENMALTNKILEFFKANNTFKVEE